MVKYKVINNNFLIKYSFKIVYHAFDSQLFTQTQFFYNIHLNLFLFN